MWKVAEKCGLTYKDVMDADWRGKTAGYVAGKRTEAAAERWTENLYGKSHGHERFTHFQIWKNSGGTADRKGTLSRYADIYKSAARSMTGRQEEK